MVFSRRSPLLAVCCVVLLVGTALCSVQYICDLDEKEVESSVTYFLFTQRNKERPHVIKFGDLGSLGPFRTQNPTMIVFHGYTSNYQYMSSHSNFKNEVIESLDINLIFPDMRDLAGNSYPCSLHQTRKAAVHTARFIEWLNREAGTNSSQFHLVGYSLGAHIAAWVGKNMSQKVGRVTGLDPAIMFFPPFLRAYVTKIDKSVADFVDVIHTNGGRLYNCHLSDFYTRGHVNIFVNGGRSQPGCKPDYMFLVLCSDNCSHGRVVQYFVESISRKSTFRAYKCSSYSEYLSGECHSAPTNRLGYYVNTSMHGDFYLATKSMSPFSGRDIRIFFNTTGHFISPAGNDLEIVFNLDGYGKETVLISIGKTLYYSTAPVTTAVVSLPENHTLSNRIEMKYTGFLTSYIELETILIHDVERRTRFSLRGPVKVGNNEASTYVLDKILE